MKAEFVAGDLTKHITMQVKITGAGRLRARLWLALLIIRLAVKVAGFNRLEVEEVAYD